MSTIPGAEFIPLAWILPAWLLTPRVALIEAACDLWADDEPLNDDEETAA